MLCVAMIVMAACGTSNSRLTFQARAADLRHAAANAPEFVEITKPGKLLTPAVDLIRIDRKDADWSTPGSAVAAIVSANLAADLSWVVESYVPREREPARRALSEPAAAARTWNFYRNMGKPVMTGWAQVDDSWLMFVQGRDEDGDTTPAIVTLKKTADGWRQTNALAESSDFEVIWIALRSGGVRPA